MKLSNEAEAEIVKEMAKSMAESDIEPLGVSSESIGNNKEIILAFLTTLVALLPGVIGKLAGQGILVAAKAWFKNKGY